MVRNTLLLFSLDWWPSGHESTTLRVHMYFQMFFSFGSMNSKELFETLWCHFHVLRELLRTSWRQTLLCQGIWKFGEVAPQSHVYDEALSLAQNYGPQIKCIFTRCLNHIVAANRCFELLENTQVYAIAACVLVAIPLKPDCHIKLTKRNHQTQWLPCSNCSKRKGECFAPHPHSCSSKWGAASEPRFMIKIIVS